MSTLVSKPLRVGLVDPSNPLSKGLRGAWFLTEGKGRTINDASGYNNHGTLNNFANYDTLWQNSSRGPIVHFNEGNGAGADCYITVGSDTSLDNLAEFTWMCRVKPQTLGRSNGGRFIQKGNAKIWHLTSNTSNNLTATVQRASVNATALTNNNEISLSAWHVMVMTYNDTDGIRLYRAVEDVATTASLFPRVTQFNYQGGTRVVGSGTPVSDAADSMILGNRNAFDRPQDGYFDWWCVWDRVLTIDEMQLMSENPYQLIEVKDDDLFTLFKNQGDGSQSVTYQADLVTGNYSIPAPTIDTQRSVTYESEIVSGSYNTFSPDIITGGSVTYQADLVSASYSIPAPTISIETSVTFQASLLSASYSTNSVDITVDSTGDGVLSAAYSIQTPTIVIGIESQILSASYSIPAPTISIVGSLTFQSPSISANYSVNSPSIIGNTNLSPNLVSANYSLLAPSIIISDTQSVETLSASYGINSPTIIISDNVESSILSASYSLLSPTISVSDTESINNPVSAAYSLYSPSINISKIVEASIVSASYDLDPSEIGISRTISLDNPISASYSLLSPNIVNGGDVVFQASLITANYGISASTQIGNANVNSSVINGTYSLQSPTIDNGSNANVNATNLSASYNVISPTIIANALVAIGTIEGIYQTLSVVSSQGITVSGSLNQGQYAINSPSIKIDKTYEASTLTASYSLQSPNYSISTIYSADILTLTGSILANSTSSLAKIIFRRRMGYG